jgi:hypothetical protein
MSILCDAQWTCGHADRQFVQRGGSDADHGVGEQATRRGGSLWVSGAVLSG